MGKSEVGNVSPRVTIMHKGTKQITNAALILDNSVASIRPVTSCMPLELAEIDSLLSCTGNTDTWMIQGFILQPQRLKLPGKISYIDTNATARRCSVFPLVLQAVASSPLRLYILQPTAKTETESTWVSQQLQSALTMPPSSGARRLWVPVAREPSSRTGRSPELPRLPASEVFSTVTTRECFRAF